MGPSGCGKSSLLHLLGGLERLAAGEVWLAGRRIDQLGERSLAALRRDGVGFVFQAFHLMDELTAVENVELPALLAGSSARSARRRARGLLEQIGLADRAGYQPAALSGGQRQRVAIARALANEPLVVLADEPTGNLDSTATLDVLRLFDSLREAGQTLVVVTHGPVRQRIGMNALGNCLGGGNRANVTIGRAVRLVMMNIGGSRPPDSDVAIHGQPGKISMCFAEDEEGTPWEPLSVERGFAPSQSTVTVAAVTGTQNVLTGVHDPDAMLTLIADSICTMGSNTVLLGGRAGQGGLGGGPVVSFSRGLARLLDRDGLTKKDVKARIFERAKKPASLMPMTLNPVRIEQVIRVDGEVHALRDPDQVVLVVAGYDSPNHTCLMPNYCVNGVVTRAVAE